MGRHRSNSFTEVPLHRTREDLIVLFHEVDEDGDGYVCYAELWNFLKRDGHGLPLHVLRSIHENADRNDDGKLDQEEFIHMALDPDNRHLFKPYLKRYIELLLPPQRRPTRDESDGAYEDEYSCCPPPLAMAVISVLEIILFVIDAIGGKTEANGPIAAALLYNPHRRREVWRFITYMFVHVGYFHLLVNVLVQNLLGTILEMVHGWWRVSLVYFAGVLAGSLGTSVVDPRVKLAGASGGVYALITAHVATIIMVDTDENGYISHRELRDFLSTNDHKLPQHVLDNIYRSADRNGDGRLDLREFTSMVYDPKNRDFFSNLFNTCLNRYMDFVLPPPPAFYRRSVSEDRRDKYGNLIRFCPPPLFMIVVSLMEVVLFAADAVNGNITATGDVAQTLIYDPKRRPQVWRYITYMLVHVRYAHLVMNLLIQILLGIVLEVFHRWWRVLLVYLAGVLAGSLGTFVFDPVHQLAGASGGVYSLITAHVATIILNWSEMQFPLSNLTVFFAFVVGDLVLVFQSDERHVSHTAHFCGAFAGLLVGVVVLRNISSNRTERIVQLIALIVYIGAMGLAIVWNIVC